MSNMPVPEVAETDARADGGDRDDTVFEEAVKHILTPRRRRITVSPDSFAAIRDAVNKP